MNRIEKRISRSLSLQIYYAWIMSQTHPNEILNHMKTLLEDKEIIDNFYMNGSPIDNSESILNEEIIKYSYQLVEFTINKSEDIDKLIIKKLKNRNIGILITDHNVRETLKIVDKVYIVNEGAIFYEGDPISAVNDEKIKKFYLGSNFKL